ncbi:MAG TPA: SurA N-terminal domain-containing protein, partial [Terriglobales bacterium]
MIRFLQQQNSTLKILLGLIIGIFIIILVITLVPGIYDWNNSANAAGTLATVGGRDVMVADVDRVAQMTMRQRHIPDQFKPMVMPRIVDQLVTESALLETANHMGLRVSDEELQEELRTGPLGQELFPKGQFIGDDAYKNWVATRANLTVDKFENLLKEELLLNKLQAVVAGAATVSDTELQDAYNLQNQKVKFAYAT